MFWNKKVDPNKNWWSYRNRDKGQALLFRQVRAALQGHEFAFFDQHPIDQAFSWKNFDEWLEQHSVRFDGPSQYNGMHWFDGFDDETKDFAHFRNTRNFAICALQLWSSNFGDGRSIGHIDNGLYAGPMRPDEKAETSKKYDHRDEWVPGRAVVGDPPLAEYVVREENPRGSAYAICGYDRNMDSGELTLANGWSELFRGSGFRLSWAMIKANKK
ncbi:hypothetical protein [Ruegeria sp. HKCCA4707]|uniref:hypothetical protein n=1 Tax=Ruegeria sp. HKCCA4707 TaxID=2682984 RepID=UPI001487C4FA|nr:hypothetical protein [Ruegeria sp. HKCCA4707]